jgi:hypothetical protein
MSVKLSKKTLRVAVVNFSGNVGKSTIAKHLLMPRLDVNIIAIETINANEGGDVLALDQFKELQDHLLDAESAIVDIGASNIEGFFQQLTNYKRSHADFDLFVVPATFKNKQQEDTISTVNALTVLGVPAKKIRVVFNMVQPNEVVDRLFAPIFAFAEAEKKCVTDPLATIYASDIFEDIKGLDVSIPQLLEYSEDELRAKIRATEDQAEKQRLKDLLIAARIAESAHENLEQVFKVITK